MPTSRSHAKPVLAPFSPTSRVRPSLAVLGPFRHVAPAPAAADRSVVSPARRSKPRPPWPVDLPSRARAVSRLDPSSPRLADSSDRFSAAPLAGQPYPDMPRTRLAMLKPGHARTTDRSRPARVHADRPRQSSPISCLAAARLSVPSATPDHPHLPGLDPHPPDRPGPASARLDPRRVLPSPPDLPRRLCSCPLLPRPPAPTSRPSPGPATPAQPLADWPSRYPPDQAASGRLAQPPT